MPIDQRFPKGGPGPISRCPLNGRLRRKSVVGGALEAARRTTELSNWGERTHSAGFLERRPVPGVVEQHEVPIGNVVQDRDADLEGRHPVVPAMDQQDGRLDAGEVMCVVERHADRLPDRIGPKHRSVAPAFAREKRGSRGRRLDSCEPHQYRGRGGFHGNVSLDPTRVGRDAGRIADEVVARFAGLAQEVSGGSPRARG